MSPWLAVLGCFGVVLIVVAGTAGLLLHLGVIERAVKLAHEKEAIEARKRELERQREWRRKRDEP